MKLIPYNPTYEGLIEKTTNKISNLDDPQTAGVFASVGFLEIIEELIVEDIDLKKIPTNIVNNLLKKVSCKLSLSNLTGLTFPMLDSISCFQLHPENLTKPSMTQDFEFSGKISLHNVSGKLSGVLKIAVITTT